MDKYYAGGCVYPGYAFTRIYGYKAMCSDYCPYGSYLLNITCLPCNEMSYYNTAYYSQCSDYITTNFKTIVTG